MKAKKVRRRKHSFIVCFTLVACVCYLLIMWIHLQMEINEKQTKYDSLSAQYAEQSQENSKLEKEIKNGISDEEMERIAREELGYVMPGEHVYADASSGE